jgi:hypothetical protein
MATNPKRRESIDYRAYIPQEWIREKLQVFELIRRLRDDLEFRHRWVESEVRKRKEKAPSMDEAAERDLLLVYLEELDFHISRNAAGKPSVHVSPKTFRGRPYSVILGISSKHLSTALNRIIDDAVDGALDGYGKGAVLTGIFGTEWGRLFNTYVVKQMQEEFSK